MIGIVDGGAVGLELLAPIVTSGWPTVTPVGAGPKVITWFALVIANVRCCGVAAAVDWHRRPGSR